jgi:L-ascorbate metabolism protein UlaG (beta-lactamase superfamily)
MLILSFLVFICVVSVVLFMNQAKFGKKASGSMLERIRQSGQFRNKQFQNLSPTPNLTEGVSFYAVLKEFLLKRKKRRKPGAMLPSKKTDLLSLSVRDDILVWFGHSSYFMQVDGIKILVDPVLSGAASPIKSTTRSFDGTDVYKIKDIPPIDCLFISHDHWDHLDYETILGLRDKTKRVITGLGTGAHLEFWGFQKSQIIEMDWNQELVLDNGLIITALPARHFSGRTFVRNRFLWVSFILKTAKMKLYLGGDSGFDKHFLAIGNKYGPFDLAILECGQYDKSWKYIHMMPEETVQAAVDLQAKWLMPVHWGKFALSNHDWDDPIIRVTKTAKQENMALVTPMIGERLDLHSLFERDAWWENIS